MMDISMVISPSKDISQDSFGVFENHTRGIGSKLMRQVGYNGQGTSKKGQGIMIPIIA
jgi:hypothetical protein